MGRFLFIGGRLILPPNYSVFQCCPFFSAVVQQLALFSLNPRQSRRVESVRPLREMRRAIRTRAAGD